MGAKKKEPKPPDPRETAAAQTGTNVTTALANAQLGNVNQITPDGSLTYSESGSRSFTDPNSGATYEIPQYTATQTLSGAQQAIKDQDDAASLNLSGLANQQSGFLKDYMAQPVDLSNEAVESRLYELGSKRLDPRFDRQREQLETRLANQGIGLGTEAYDRAMEGFGQNENDAYNQLLLNGRGQAVQEALTQRNQPINEITALLSGSQVSNPNFVNTQQPQIPTVDYAGLVNQNYQNELGAYNQQQAQTGNIISQLGALPGYFLSDERAKKDKKKIGSVKGMRYKGEPASTPKHTGLMAQEVMKKRPDAVKKGRDGLFSVNYAKAMA